MSLYFMDSSAISKGYMLEVGSAWITSLIGRSAGHVIVISELAIVEVSSAIARKQRFAAISSSDAARNRADFLQHADKQYLTMPLEVKLLRGASGLVIKHPLRSLDAIQLSCALEASTILGESLIFLSADNDLLTAAAAEGFVTDNPLSHP